MNENNQPQSQQTKRELGYYHCRWVNVWVIARWNGHEWMHEGVSVVLIFDEIDERRITRHSPTEQPGDSANNYKCADCGTAINEGEFKTFGICDDCWDRHHKKVQPPNSNEDEGFKKLVIDTFHELYPYSSGPHLNELFILAERISKYERAKQAELVEENQRLKKENARLDEIIDEQRRKYARR